MELKYEYLKEPKKNLKVRKIIEKLICKKICKVQFNNYKNANNFMQSYRNLLFLWSCSCVP